eukprot:5436099-Amphidinium_carterae.1
MDLKATHLGWTGIETSVRQEEPKLREKSQKMGRTIPDNERPIFKLCSVLRGCESPLWVSSPR